MFEHPYCEPGKADSNLCNYWEKELWTRKAHFKFALNHELCSLRQAAACLTDLLWQLFKCVCNVHWTLQIINIANTSLKCTLHSFHCDPMYNTYIFHMNTFALKKEDLYCSWLNQKAISNKWSVQNTFSSTWAAIAKIMKTEMWSTNVLSINEMTAKKAAKSI